MLKVGFSWALAKPALIANIKAVTVRNSRRIFIVDSPACGARRVPGRIKTLRQAHPAHTLCALIINCPSTAVCSDDDLETISNDTEGPFPFNAKTSFSRNMSKFCQARSEA